LGFLAGLQDVVALVGCELCDAQAFDVLKASCGQTVQPDVVHGVVDDVGEFLSQPW